MFDSIWINGRIVPLVDARVSPASAGALYGWGVFTTLGVRGGAARAFGPHWERLSAHAARARVALAWAREEVEAGLAALLAESGITEGRARITVLRSAAGFWSGLSERESDAFVFVAKRAPAEKGPVALTVSPFRINTASPLAGLKATAYVDHLVALEEARARGFDEAVMLNERGEIVEATAANIFWTRDGGLYTSSLATGCLAGITRRFVLEAATRRKIRVTEGSYPLAALGEADEIFLTNSGWGLVPAAQFDIHTYKAPGSMVALLAADVEAVVRGP
jgi:branched-subunit amino acid aminotransferase/4-amino-4-deoxychorismate lyase